MEVIYLIQFSDFTEGETKTQKLETADWGHAAN